jgi:Bacterial conjugation TrbI-like protein
MSSILLGILVIFFSDNVFAAGSSCEGEDCFFEEPGARRMKKEEVKPVLAPKALLLPQSIPPSVKAKKMTKAKKDQIRVSSSVPLSTDPPLTNRNIPNYMMRHDGPSEPYSVGSLSVNSKEIIEKISGVRDGDYLYASLPQEIKASPQAPISIRVTLLSGAKRGSLLMGEATLDAELKRVFLTFNKFRDQEDDEVYAVEAEGQNLKGERGIEGEYHTEEGKFFLVSLLTGFLGVLADSSVNRNQTAYGTWTQEPTLANSALASAGSTLVQQGSRFAQKADQAPQYTQTEGNQMIRVMIKSDPIRKL